MDSAARAALLGAALLPRLSAETIQEHLLELGKQSFEVRSKEWVTSTLDDDVFGDNFGTNPDFSYDDPRNYPVTRDFENPRHACFEDDAAFPWVKFSDARSLATVVSGDVRDLLDERFNLAPLWKRKFYGEPWNVEDLGFENADGHFREMYEKVGEHPDLEMLDPRMTWAMYAKTWGIPDWHYVAESARAHSYYFVRSYSSFIESKRWLCQFWM